MTNSRHCSTQQLQQLLVGDSQSPVAVQRLETHVEHCQQCQFRLAELAGDASWWSRAGDHLSSQNGAEEWERDGNAGQAADEALLKQVFGPPAHPEMLGRLEQYDVEALLGRGGMGVVYKGFDRQLNRPVAIKMMSPYLASNGTARRRFEREARAAAAVVHPNVIPIHAVNASHTLPYIVMPLVGGRSLQTHIDRQGPMEVKDIVRVANQIASGLAAAHRQGLVHRDIKPANILIEQDVSRVLITDFGLARAADDAAMTQTGWLAGTPHYMSPEQAAGHAVDARSDLFSLGSVMYFMATGRPPFRADKPVAVLHRICSQPLTHPRQLNTEIPQTLSDIIEKLLEKPPAHRFQRADEVQQLLERYLAHLQHPARKSSPPRVLTQRAKRLRKYSAMAALGCALLAVCGWGMWRLGGSPRPALPPVAPRASAVMSDQRLQSEIGQLWRDIESLERQMQLEWPTSILPAPAVESNGAEESGPLPAASDR